MKTIANLILDEMTSRTGTDLYEYRLLEMDRLCAAKDQNFQAESTTYIFEDGSELTDHLGAIR